MSRTKPRLFTKKRVIFLAGLIAIGAIIIPNLRGSLKALGLLERDFIPSTSGAIYETQNHSFTARIGDKNDPGIVSLFYQINDADFSLTLVKPSVIIPTPIPLPTDAASVSVDLLDQVALLEASVSAVQSDALKMTGTTSQSYFGPHETVRQNQVLGGEINYYIVGENLVQEWRLVDKVNQVQFMFKSNSSSLHIDSSFNWNIRDNHGNGVTITTQLYAANGTPVPLAEVPVKDIENPSSGTIVTLPIPATAVDNYATMFPLRLVRTFTSSASSANVGLANPDLVSVGPTPRFITEFAGIPLVGDPTTQTILRITAHTAEPLLSGVSVTGLACTTTNCYVATEHDLYQFDPTQLLAETDIAKRTQLLESVSTDFVISSLGASSTSLFATSNANPNGAVYQKTSTGFSSNFTGLVFPTQISSTPTGDLSTLLAGGQIWSRNTQHDWTPINLPLTPQLVSAGSSGQVYFTATYPRTGEDIVFRLDPQTNMLEVLANVSGEFSALYVTNDSVYLGISGSSTGYIWPISLAASRWVTTQEFTAQ